MPETPTQWRSLAELEKSPGFEETLLREFPREAEAYQESGLSKREFVKLMGASLALAGVGGLAGCRRPEAYMVPFTKGVEWSIPGKFLYYATAMPIRGGVMPLVVSTVDGRPTKIEGNPLHPASNGATDGFAQASILDLYDPHRAKEITRAGQTATFNDLSAFLSGLLTKKSGKAAILVERKNSPTRDRLRAAVEKQLPGVLWVEYEPLGNAEEAKATVAAVGEGLRLIPKFDRADVILALDSDFLSASDNGVAYSSGFYPRRNPDQKGAPMNRLYVVENHYTTTGGMADHRLRCKASEVGEFTRRLALHLAGALPDSPLAALAGAAPQTPAELDDRWIAACGDDLVANAGRSIVTMGQQQPAWAQALAHAINEALGNHDATIFAAETGERPAVSIQDLAKAIGDGRVETLLILGGNPVYNAPADLNFSALLSKVPESLHLSLFKDETSALCQWHVPAAHYLESWSDARSFDGTYSSIQPMILPLWNGVSELEILALLAGQARPEGPELIRQTFAGLTGTQVPPREAGKPLPDFADASAAARWKDFLRVGFLADTAFKTAKPSLNTRGIAGLCDAAKQTAAENGLELVFLQSSSVDDGRYAHNAWLQETPDFETKVTWDNVALVSPATAKKLGIRFNNYSALYEVPLVLNKLTSDENLHTDTDFDIIADIIEISVGGQSIRAAAVVAPGHAEDSLSLALGYGRTGQSAVLENVGFNAYPLRVSGSPRFRQGITVKRTGEEYPLARTQEAKSMHGRDLFREGTTERYAEDPKFAQTMGMDGHIPENISLYTNPPLTAKEQWGMAIDLNVCIGCNACLVACQAENNVPVVGKAQVRRNRDMAWIRIDRYFAGDPENPEMLAQAVMCQHCENAPCETVCPVNATVHSEDGLNLMAYNRCIGTRYCANNCPWKVRRFNFFDYNQRPLERLYWGPLAKKGMADSLKMGKNPNVTVRMRGVMEKCTFCIQRIEEAKIGRLVEAGARDKNQFPIKEFKVACQQACPSDAIVFGNINDPNHRVTRLRESDRGYVMFKYLNVRPRVTYLARIKNPNPRMPDAARVGLANGEAHGHHAGVSQGEPSIETGHNHGAETSQPTQH